MKDKIFSVLQRVGRSFMLPIAILPVAGLLLGIGSSFTNATTIETYGLTSLLGNGTILHALLVIMNKVGSAVFDNLPLIFAVGVAIGMAKKEKEVSALSAVIAYFVMNTAINAMLTITGQILENGEIAESVLEGTITSVCGIQSLQMGVFGGIIVGLGVAALHNRFYRIQLPNALSFFGGTRFVPIISTIVYMFVGILMYFVWPVVQNGIYALGGLVTGSGYVGTLIFGLIKRALIPFGLHHVFYMPFWQTAVGGTMEVAGQMVQGGQNIFFAQLADSANVAHFSADATRYFSGELSRCICTEMCDIRRIYFYDFRTSGSGTCHVPLCETREEKSSRRSASFRSTCVYGNRYHRTAGILFPVCCTGVVCRAGYSCGNSLYDRTHPEYRSRSYLFRRTSGLLPVRYSAGK